MKKARLVLIIALLALLCACFACCDLFKPNPDDGGGSDDVFKLENATIGKKGGVEYYTGKAVVFDVVLYGGNNQTLAEIKAGEEHPDLTVIFSDNVEVGVGKVTVTAKSGSKKFSGKAETTFDIRPVLNAVKANDLASLKKYLEGGRYGEVRLTAQVEVPEGDKIAILGTTKLCLNGFDLVNNGEIVNGGTFVTGGSTDSGKLVNHGKFTNAEGAKFVFDTFGGIIHDGQFENYGKFDKSENNYFDVNVYADAEINVEFPYFVRVYNRIPMSDESVVLNAASMPYTGNAIIPSLVLGEVGKDYEISCEQNVNVGEYSVTFTATKNSKFYNGQKEFKYTIAPIWYTAQSEADFLKAVQSPNYDVITYNPANRDTTPAFNVLPNVRVNITRCNPTIDVVGAGATLNASDFCTLKVNNVEQGATLNLGKYCYLDLPSRGQNTAVNLGKDSVINVKNRTVIYCNVSGEGAINVGLNAELFFGAKVTSCNVGVNNLGSVYSNFALSNVSNSGSGVAVVRTHLASSEVDVTNPEYTGKEVKVQCAFPHSDDSVFQMYYKFDGVADETKKKLPQEVGQYQAELRFSDVDKHYFGNTEFLFEVARGVYKADSSFNLKRAIASGNYDCYEIMGVWRNNEAIELPAGQTFTASESLINNADITVCGSLVVQKCINVNGKTITVNDGGKFVINGTYFHSPQAELSVEQGATVQNNGTAYLCDVDVDGLGGNKVFRKPLSEATFTVTQNAVYKTKPAPEFQLHYAGVLVDENVYTALFSNNHQRTEGNDASADVAAKADDPDFYGGAIYPFPVLGGEITVSSDEDLYAALNDVAPNGLCNYAVITTSWTLSVVERKDGSVADYSVRQGTTLAIKHNVTFGSSSPDFAKFKLQNDGVIEIYGSARLRYAAKWQENGSGVFKLFASEASHFDRNSETPYYDEIILEKDVDLGVRGSLKIYASANGTTVNLNNHKISVSSIANVTLYTRAHEITVTSGRIEGKVVIAREDDSALNTEPAGKVILRNLTITKEVANELHITVETYNVT